VEEVHGKNTIVINSNSNRLVTPPIRCWMYAGMAIRMAMELGLHEESTEKESQVNGSLEKLSEQEMKRRVFWTIFIIDQ
jgi:hypothetical protein